MEGSTSLVTGSTPEAVNKANLFAHAAEEYAERGQYAQAVEAHFRAAEQFLLATSYTADPEAIKTLKLLYANHTRQGKDLQRRFQSRSSTASPSSPSPSNATPRQTASSISSQASPLNQSPYSDRPSSAGRVKPSMVAVPLPNTDLKSSSTRQRPTSYPSTAPQNTRTPTSSSTPTSAFSRSSSGDEVKYSLIDTTGNVRSLEDLGGSGYGYGSRNFFVGQSTTPDATTVLPKVSRGAQHPASFRMPQDAPATVDAISLDGNTGRNLYDSIEKSYFVLGEDSQEVQKDDPEDPFNKFWDAVENLVQKISLPAPLAFTTAPIFQKAGDITYEAADQRDAAPGMRLPYAFGYGANRSAAKETIRESQIGGTAQRNTAYPNMTETLRSTNMLNSYFVVGDSMAASEQAGVARGNSAYGAGGGVITNHMEPENNLTGPISGSVNIDALNLDSNYFGRAGGGRFDDGVMGGEEKTPVQTSASMTRSQAKDLRPSTTKTREELLIENEQLKQTIDFLTRRMTVLEKAAEENTMLRSSIIQFRHDLQRQAKRFGQNPATLTASALSSSVRRPMHLSMAAGVSSSMTSSSSSPTGSTAGVQPVPPLPRQSVQEGDVMVRLAALERELAGVREESERRGEEVAKYKDRWQKLKESARKKKEAKMGVTDAGVVVDDVKASQYRQGGTSLVMSRGVDYHSDTSTSDTYNTTTITLEDDGLSAGAPIMSPALGSISTKSPPPSSSKRIPGSSASFSASTDASYPQGYTSLHTSRISPPVNDTRSDPSRSTFRIDSQDPTSLPSPNTTTAPSIPLPRHSVTSPPSLTAKSPKLARQNSSSSTRSAGGIRSDPRSRNPSAQDNWDPAASMRSDVMARTGKFSGTASVASGSMFYSMSSQGGVQGEEEFFDY